MINIRGIFRQDKRYCYENDICDINFNSVEEFKDWVHKNCYSVSDKYIREYKGLKEDYLLGFLGADSKYNKCHVRGNATVDIFIVTEETYECGDSGEYEYECDRNTPKVSKILYSNGNLTDGHKHLGERMKEILGEINKNIDRSKFNFA